MDGDSLHAHRALFDYAGKANNIFSGIKYTSIRSLQEFVHERAKNKFFLSIAELSFRTFLIIILFFTLRLCFFSKITSFFGKITSFFSHTAFQNKIFAKIYAQTNKK